MVIIGCDHAAVSFKKEIIRALNEQGVQVLDVGADGSAASDYPDYAEKVCREVLKEKAQKGILICGTGIGMSIAANKFKGIRCALCADTFSAHAARLHNNANILALGCRVIGEGLALDIVDAFLNTEFSKEERHVRRIDKITALEKKN